MNTKDVTSDTCFGNPDDEALPITKCPCGEEFRKWEFVISIYEDMPDECPKCGRRFYFVNSIKIIEVLE